MTVLEAAITLLLIILSFCFLVWFGYRLRRIRGKAPPGRLSPAAARVLRGVVVVVMGATGGWGVWLDLQAPGPSLVARAVITLACIFGVVGTIALHESE